MRIVIVGGGCSGLLVAFHLFRNGCRDAVTIVEPRAELGRGIAYSTTFEGHLLNVGAEKLSALTEEPPHFLEWLKARGFPGVKAGFFAPRRVYGDYLGELLRGFDDLEHVRAEVLGLETDSDGVRLTLSNGSALEADKVVLALGNPLCGAWDGDAFRLRAPGERVLLIGAGQTAVDAVLALQSQPGGCRIHMLSRSGLLPQVHPLRSTALPAFEIAGGENVRTILRRLRARIREARDQGICWQAVIDSLRPVSNLVWQQLPVEERRRFHRRLKTFWETHRSRMAPSIGTRLDGCLADASVEAIAGRLIEAIPNCECIDVRIALRGRGGERTLQVDRIIECTGIQEHYHERPRPLIQALLRDGLAEANDLGIGFRTDGEGALIGPAADVLFTLGPPRRGELLETIAVPEIRVQAEALAQRLLEIESR